MITLLYACIWQNPITIHDLKNKKTTTKLGIGNVQGQIKQNS